MIELVDTHAHLDQDDFDADRDAVLARAQAVGVSTVLSIGVSLPTSRAAIALAARYPQVKAVVGIQPNHCLEAEPGDWDEIVQLASASGVVALGETGLDRFWKDVPFDLQQDYFDRHLRLSQQIDLPFVVHMRDCEADVLEMLRTARQRGPLRGVMHSFTGTAAGAAECVQLGLHISFAGMVTYKKSTALREVAAAVPADRILVETDSPYLSPEPVRGTRRNEPANVAHTAKLLAEVRGIDLPTFAAQTTANARAIFKL